MVATIASTAQPGGAYPRPGKTALVSIARDTTSVTDELLTTGSYGSKSSAISADGRFIAFDSDRSDLVQGDTNFVTDIFVRDMERGTTERVSVSSAGEQGLSVPGGIVADGRCYYVPSTNGIAQETTRGTGGAAISADGRYVAFWSCFDNLVPGDTNKSVDAFVHDRLTKETIRVDLTSKGEEVSRQASNTAALPVAISANGRFVTFASTGSNLVAGDTNKLQDIFVHDIKNHTTERVSVDSKGAQIEQGSVVSSAAAANCPSISADGRFVSFMTSAANLVENDTNDSPDIFVHDRKTGATERVSTGSDGTEANDGSTLCYGGTEPPQSSISGNGRYVVFNSLATNLVPNFRKSPVEAQDTYVKDRRTGRTERISVTASGEEIRGTSETAAISQNGHYVVFRAYNNYFPRDTGDWRSYCSGCGDPDIFVADRSTGAIDWASQTSENGEPQHCDPEVRNSSDASGRLDKTTSYSNDGSISADGRYVSFVTCADNMVPEDEDTMWDVYLRDRGPGLGTGDLHGPSGEPDSDPSETCVLPDVCVPICLTPELCIPPGTEVTANDAARDVDELLTHEGANIHSASLAYRPQYRDLYAAIELENMPAVIPGVSPLLYGLRLDVKGRSYAVRASSHLGGTFQLFDCTGAAPVCTKIADLHGGYGTTGMRVVFTLPLKDIGLEHGGDITHAQAFSALGTLLTGPALFLDKNEIR